MAHHFSHSYARWNSVLFLFASTPAGVVSCGGPKMSPRTSSIVQIMFSFWSFEINGDILRNQKFIIGLGSFSNQRLIYVFGPIWIILVFVLTTFLKISNLAVIPFLLQRVTEEA